MLYLFYDFDKKRKVGFLRGLKVIAFIWVTCDVTYLYGFLTYPTNQLEYSDIETNWLSVILVSGVIFGYDLLIFYSTFVVMNEKLIAIYIHNIRFNPLLHIIKTYL